MIEMTTGIHDGHYVMQFIDGKFAGCKFIFADLAIGELADDGDANVSFDYSIVNDFVLAEDDAEEFEGLLKQHMEKLLVEAIEQNTAEFDSNS